MNKPNIELVENDIKTMIAGIHLLIYASDIKDNEKTTCDNGAYARDVITDILRWPYYSELKFDIDNVLNEIETLWIDVFKTDYLDQYTGFNPDNVEFKNVIPELLKCIDSTKSEFMYEFFTSVLLYDPVINNDWTFKLSDDTSSIYNKTFREMFNRLKFTTDLRITNEFKELMKLLEGKC